MNKHEKLSCVIAKLQQLTEFLEPYLPLANVHNTNFVVSSHWDTMIPEGIGLQLLQLDDRELSLLPSGELFCNESDHGLANSYDSDTKDCCSRMNPVEANAKYSLKADLFTTCDQSHGHKMDDVTHREEMVPTDCDLVDAIDEQCKQNHVLNASDQAEPSIVSASDDNKSGHSHCFPEWNHSLAMDWQHQSLREFITTAVSCTLPQLGLLTSLSELSNVLALPSSDSQYHIVVSHAMKVKKSYEVDVMASLCAWIADGFNISNVSICNICNWAKTYRHNAVDFVLYNRALSAKKSA